MRPEAQASGVTFLGFSPTAVMSAPSGHVFRSEGKRRPVWRAKYRLPDGRQIQKTLGPAWTDRGRPPAGYFTKRTAEAWLRKTLVEAAAGTLRGMVRTGATVADACDEYLRYIEQDRQRVERWAAHEIDPSPPPSRPPPRRAHRSALARRRLRRLSNPSQGELHERPPHVAEVRQGPLSPDGAEGGRNARASQPARLLDR
jgi:hypothetical protein